MSLINDEIQDVKDFFKFRNSAYMWKIISMRIDYRVSTLCCHIIVFSLQYIVRDIAIEIIPLFWRPFYNNQRILSICCLKD